MLGFPRTKLLCLVAAPTRPTRKNKVKVILDNILACEVFEPVSFGQFTYQRLREGHPKISWTTYYLTSCISVVTKLLYLPSGPGLNSGSHIQVHLLQG